VTAAKFLTTWSREQSATAELLVESTINRQFRFLEFMRENYKLENEAVRDESHYPRQNSS